MNKRDVVRDNYIKVVSKQYAGVQDIAECLHKKVLNVSIVWLQHEKDCFDNPTTYLPYMAMFVALPSIYER